jgi:iron complex outermembrane receptor protein
VPRSGSILGTFLDVGGVEVLRGPQGTLFGRNASVGALSISSALPRSEFSGELSGEIGSFDRYKLSGFVNVPLTSNVSARFAGMSQWYKGAWKNRLDGKTYGGSDDVSFRGTIKADLGDLEWIVRGDYTRLDGDGVSNFDFDARSVSPDRLAFIQAAFNGGPDTNLGDRKMNQFVNSGLIDKNWGLSSTASLDVGGSTLKLINSYRKWTNNQLDGDIIFFPISLLSRRSLFDSKSQNHELQFISPEKEWLGGKFDMVAGLYYFEEDFALGEDINLGSQFCNVLVPAGSARTACNAYYAMTGGERAAEQHVFQNVRSIAAYGQGNIYLADRLTLTLGGRWTKDRKRGDYDQVSSPFTQTIRAPESLIFPGISESRFTYRISLNYKPADDVLLFVNHSTGYKSAGYNSGPGSPGLSTFDEDGNLVSTRRLFDRETVKNYEAGIKAKWLDRALTTNITFYRMDIGGFQDRAFDGVSFIVRNAGNLRQQGFELDLVAAPVRNFSVSASIAYLDSKFTSYPDAANLPGLGGTQDLRGKPNTFSPEWTGNFAVDWTGDIGSSGMSWALNANLSFMSDQYNGTVLDANPQTLADGYALLGGRLTLNGADDRWSISVFGRNLTNKHYQPLSVYQPLNAALGLNNTIFPGSTANRIQAAEPRTFGASATIRF